MIVTMCGVQLKERKRAENFVLTLGSNERMDVLAMENSAR